MTTGDGIDMPIVGALFCAVEGGLYMREGSTYGVGGFAMIEARDNGESSRAGGADTEIRFVEGRKDGDKDFGGAGGGKDVEA